jgi:hypothetical protein
MKLQMKREALKKLNRNTNETQPGLDTEEGTVGVKIPDCLKKGRSH